MSREKNFSESQIIIPLLTKLFRSRWLDNGLVLFFFFCEFMNHDSVSVHKHAKKKKGKNLVNLKPSSLDKLFVGKNSKRSKPENVTHDCDHDVRATMP